MGSETVPIKLFPLFETIADGTSTNDMFLTSKNLPTSAAVPSCK